MAYKKNSHGKFGLFSKKLNMPSLIKEEMEIASRLESPDALARTMYVHSIASNKLIDSIPFKLRKTKETAKIVAAQRIRGTSIKMRIEASMPVRKDVLEKFCSEALSELSLIEKNGMFLTEKGRQKIKSTVGTIKSLQKEAREFSKDEIFLGPEQAKKVVFVVCISNDVLAQLLGRKNFMIYSGEMDSMKKHMAAILGVAPESE